MRGPLPVENHRHRNAPTIPTTSLPAGGREGPVPKLPSFARLGKQGRAWWRWAWSTPQAAAWAAGHEGIVARRASLEDDLTTLDEVDGLDFTEVLDADTAQRVRVAVQRLAGLAAGRLQVMREMRELDDRLGLTPKAMAQLRWTIKGSDVPVGAELPQPVTGPNVVAPERWQRTAAG